MLRFKCDFCMDSHQFCFRKTLGECLTICQTAGTQECENQEEIHSDLLVQETNPGMRNCIIS